MHRNPCGSEPAREEARSDTASPDAHRQPHLRLGRMTLSLLEVVRMFIGILLVITWLILLLRYPAKALPVSVAAAIGLGFVAMWVVWLDNREIKQLARLELRIAYAPEQCPADRPLQCWCLLVWVFAKDLWRFVCRTSC